jgi:beta-galactosidase
MPNEENYEHEAETPAQAESHTEDQTQEEPKKRVPLRKSEAGTGRRDRRRRPEGEPEPAAPTEPPVIVAPAGAEDVLAHLSWRPRQAHPTEPDKEDGRPQKKLAERPKRAEPTKRAERQEPKPEAPKPEAPKPDRKPKRKSVRIPAEAAQVVLHDGLPSLVHKKRILSALMFSAYAGNQSQLDTVVEEAKMATDQGVAVICLIIELLVDPGQVAKAVETTVRQVKAVAAECPSARFIVRTDFVAPRDWDRRYKRARYKSGDEPSVCDDEYWGDAEGCLTEFVKAVRASEVADRVIGVHLDRHGWFYGNGKTVDTSDAAKAGFGEWLRHRYRDDDVSLRAAWFDGRATFENADVPPPTNGKAGEEFVRTGRRARRWVDYNLFLSDTTVDRIAKLANAAKTAGEGWLLVGTTYGYTFEWSYPGSGHLSLGKLLRCPDVDYISGPPSYKGREPGGSAPFPAPIDSFALNGKLYISEDDFKTPISGGSEPDQHNPVMKTPQALESAHWRSAGAALAHRSGATWMDSWGNGWLTSRGIWQRGGTVRRAFEQRYAANHRETDVAVFVDERSLAYLVDEQAFEALVQNVRESVLRSGLSASFYLLSDLAHRENFPEAKLYVFMNAWDIRPEVRSAIKTRLQRDGKVLFWLYCAGLFEAGRDALERVREVTGIALKPQPFHSRTGTTLLNQRHPVCSSLPIQKLAEGGRLEPSYFAIPEDASVFGEYTHSGLPSYVVRHFTGDSEGTWTSVFLGEPIVTPGLFRALGQMAGAHVWNFDDDVVHVRAPFLTVHCKGAGQRTITVPNNWSVYDAVTGDWATVESNGVRFTAIDGHTYVFFTGTKADVEALVNADPTSLLKLDKIEAKEDDTVHWDAVQFDVQIMKLDEWVEENWTEQHADDLLLKPSMLDVDTEEAPEEEEGEPTSRGRRRSRGRGRGRGRSERGGRRRGSEETANPRREGADKAFDDAGIGVLFRKKQ